VVTFIKRANVYIDILTDTIVLHVSHMCRAGFAEGIQIIVVLATFGLILIENLLTIPEIHVVWHCF